MKTIFPPSICQISVSPAKHCGIAVSVLERSVTVRDDEGNSEGEIYPPFSLAPTCMEANFPDAIKNQRGASRGLLMGQAWLILYGIRLLAQATLKAPFSA